MRIVNTSSMLVLWAATLNICSFLSRTSTGSKLCYRPHLSVVLLLSEHIFLSSSFNALCSFPADSIPQEIPRTSSLYQVAFRSINHFNHFKQIFHRVQTSNLGQTWSNQAPFWRSSPYSKGKSKSFLHYRSVKIILDLTLIVSHIWWK